MYKERPRLEIKMTITDKVIESISILLLLFSWIYVMLAYNELQDSIPSHFNSKGQVDGYSTKQTIWLLPIISTTIYLGVFILTKFPHIHNYMVTITKENAEKNYKFSITILRIVNFLCVLMFAYINFKIIEGAKTSNTNLGNEFIILIIIGSITIPLIAYYYQRKITNNG